MRTWWCPCLIQHGGGDRLFRAKRISFRFGLVRNHYVGRTFIEPRQSIRSFGVRIKLIPCGI